MGTQSDNTTSKYLTEELNKEIDSYFEYLVKEHINLQNEMYKIKSSYYNGFPNHKFESDVESNKKEQQFILEYMCFLGQIRKFPEGSTSNKQIEHIEGKIKEENQQNDLYLVVKEQYIKTIRSDYFTADYIVKTKENVTFSIHWLWQILYLWSRIKELNQESLNCTCKKSFETSTDMEMLKTMQGKLEKIMQQISQQQENLIECMDKIKKISKKNMV